MKCIWSTLTCFCCLGELMKIRFHNAEVWPHIHQFSKWTWVDQPLQLLRFWWIVLIWSLILWTKALWLSLLLPVWKLLLIILSKLLLSTILIRHLLLMVGRGVSNINFVIGKAFFKASDGFAQRFTNIGDAVGPKKNKNDAKYDNNLPKWRTHELVLLLLFFKSKGNVIFYEKLQIMPPFFLNIHTSTIALATPSLTAAAAVFLAFALNFFKF